MFERHRGMKAAKKYQQELNRWQRQREGFAEIIAFAKNFDGEPSSDILLEPDEALFARITRASLIENQRDVGSRNFRPRGIFVPPSFAFPYRSGSATSGRSSRGARVSSAIDVGVVYVTDKRVVFQGTKQIREFRYDKLLGFQHDSKHGKTVFSVSNEPRPTTIHYGAKLSDWFALRMALALSHYRNEVSALVTQLEGGLAALDARKPQPPSL